METDQILSCLHLIFSISTEKGYQGIIDSSQRIALLKVWFSFQESVSSNDLG